MKPGRVFNRFLIPPQLLILILLLVFGFLLRLSGLWWGLPFIYHPDEPQVVAPAINLIKSGDLNPHYLIYPGFTIYANAVVFLIYYLVKLELAKAFNDIQFEISIYRVPR